MPVNRAARDVRGLGDVRQRGARDAAFAKHMLGDIQYAMPRFQRFVFGASCQLGCSSMRANGLRTKSLTTSTYEICPPAPTVFFILTASLHTYKTVCKIVTHCKYAFSRSLPFVPELSHRQTIMMFTLFSAPRSHSTLPRAARVLAIGTIG